MSSRHWLLVLGGEVRDAGLRVVRHRAAERLEVDLLARDRLDDVGAGDEHVRGLLHHEDEVGDRGGVDGAAGARPHDQRDLRDDAGALDVADEDVAVGAERDDALLDPRAARVVDADDRAADLRGEVHDLAHLLGHDLAERAAEDREVLGEDADAAAVDRAVAGDDARRPTAGSSACRSRTCGGARTCRAPGRSRGRAASRCARAPCTCPWRAASPRPRARSGGGLAQLLELGELLVERLGRGLARGHGAPDPIAERRRQMCGGGPGPHGPRCWECESGEPSPSCDLPCARWR